MKLIINVVPRLTPNLKGYAIRKGNTTSITLIESLTARQRRTIVNNHRNLRKNQLRLIW